MTTTKQQQQSNGWKAKTTSTAVSLAVALFLLIGEAEGKIGESGRRTLQTGEVDYDVLGTPSLELLKYSYDFSIDPATCQYTFKTVYTHPETFPIGDANKCQPGVDAPEDNMSYLVGRWRWERVPSYMKAAIGVDHVSIDYNPCGHPGNGFLTPHYDLHFYRVTPEYRATFMNCNLLPGTPACLPLANQNEPGGTAFFSVAKALVPVAVSNPGQDEESLNDNVFDEGVLNDGVIASKLADDESNTTITNNTNETQNVTGTDPDEATAVPTEPEQQQHAAQEVAQEWVNVNMPAGYVAHTTDAVINMGTHAWNPAQEPHSPEEWLNPIYIIVVHDGMVIAVEPMLPFHYAIGTESHYWEETVSYPVQTISNLPLQYSVEFNGDTGETTTIMHGPSDICHDDYEALKALGDQNDALQFGSGAGTGGTSGASRMTTTPSWRSLVSSLLAVTIGMMAMAMG